MEKIKYRLLKEIGKNSETAGNIAIFNTKTNRIVKWTTSVAAALDYVDEIGGILLLVIE